MTKTAVHHQKVEKNFHTSLKSSSIVRKKLQQYAHYAADAVSCRGIKRVRQHHDNQISQNFDAGAIEVVKAEQAGDIQLNLRKDSNADFCQWFPFPSGCA
jgi:hypothetical protein